MDEKDFTRFEQLYNLAMNNPDHNEVRNAAVLVVKMIGKHNLLSTIRDSIGGTNNNWTPPPQNSSTSSARQEAYKAKQAASTDPKYSYLNFEHLAIKHKYANTSAKASFTIDYIVDFLDEQYIRNGDKDLVIGVPTIVNLALTDNLITPAEILLYTKQIRLFLQKETNVGILVGVRGRSGGYKLA